MIRLVLAIVASWGLFAGAAQSEAATQSNEYSLRVNFYLVSASEWLPKFRESEIDFADFEALKTITSGGKYHLIAHVFDEPADLNSVCLVQVEYVAGETLTIGRYGDEFCYLGWNTSAAIQPRMKTYGLGYRGAKLSVIIDDLQFDFARRIEFVDEETKQ